MVKKLTNEDIIRRMYDLVGEEYTKLDNVYHGTHEKFKIKHELCGHEYQVAWNPFQKGSRCPNCKGKHLRNKFSFTNNDIEQKIRELVGSEYTKLEGSYINANTKFLIKHEICKHEYEVAWSHFKRGSRCPKCFKNNKHTDFEVTNMISNITNNEYTKISKYKNSNTKFRIKHNVCDHEYSVRLYAFQRGDRCPKCSKNYSHTDLEMTEIISEKTNGEYTKLGKYINAKTKFSVKHKCGFKYEVCWSAFNTGSRCPKCNQSKGEKFISDYLANQNILFTTQVRFNDCRLKNPLPFDSGLVDSSKKVIALIEYDGEQHFKPVRFTTNTTQEQAEENLKTLQLRDKIKNQYCKDNNIPLLRIRYDEDIEEKLAEFLKELDLIQEPLLKIV